MSFKLTTIQSKKRTELVSRLHAADANIEGAIEIFNEKLDKLKEPLEAAIAAYNTVVDDMRKLANEIVSDAETDISDKSEKWQEGDRGQAAIAFQEEWDSLDLEAYEVDLPERIIYSEPDHAQCLEQAPEEAESS